MSDEFRKINEYIFLHAELLYLFGKVHIIKLQRILCYKLFERMKLKYQMMRLKYQVDKVDKKLIKMFKRDGIWNKEIKEAMKDRSKIGRKNCRKIIDSMYTKQSKVII